MEYLFDSSQVYPVNQEDFRPSFATNSDLIQANCTETICNWTDQCSNAVAADLDRIVVDWARSIHMVFAVDSIQILEDLAHSIHWRFFDVAMIDLWHNSLTLDDVASIVVGDLIACCLPASVVDCMHC